MENIMRTIRIEKIVLNMGCGTKTSIDHAMKILEMITNRKPIIVQSRKRSTFNIPKGKDIGCKITIRKEIDSFLKRLFVAKDNTLKSSNFDNKGNFAFGIHEYIDVPGMEYDPKIGILGFDICVTLERPGYRIKKRKLN